MTDATGEQVLACPMDPDGNDAGASSVREYLTRLLEVLWDEQDAFSGKRPFGNSGWNHEVYRALAKAGLIESSYDAEWDEWDYDGGEADRLVLAAIRSLR